MNTSVYPPQIIEETNLGIQRFDIRDAMLASRELELSGPVDSESVAVIIRGILYLQKVDAAAPITLFINSPGGEVSSGLALYDVMQAASCPIRTVCLGLAASMAALLFIAGDTRDMLPHSRVMVHDPLISGGVGRQRPFSEGASRRLDAHSRYNGAGHCPAFGNGPRAGLRDNRPRHLLRGGRCGGGTPRRSCDKHAVAAQCGGFKPARATSGLKLDATWSSPSLPLPVRFSRPSIPHLSPTSNFRSCL